MKIAINGFGRIGRAFFKLAARNPHVEVVAINDLSDKENLEYLLKYDSVYGRFDGGLDNVNFLQEENPINLPWSTLGIDVVVESTGFFKTLEKAHAHIEAGAKRVIISAPSPDAKTILIGVNDSDVELNNITSNASCTTNAVSPVLGVLDEEVGIESALLNTVHGYTSTQNTVDTTNKKDPRRGRAAAINIIPTTTGAAKATAKAHTQLEGRFNGIALRVPVPSGSIADVTFVAKRTTSQEEINAILKRASENDKWKGLLAVTEEPLVSTDILGRPVAAIADLSMTRVVNGNLVKVLAWYDNEVGYARTLLEHVLKAGGNL